MGYIVRENDTNPVIKKENVYITGHAQDAQWFQLIGDDVLNLWDCKVYTEAGSQAGEDMDEHLLFLRGMSLVIVVVTERFLAEENMARDVDIAFLKEKQIPFLPITVEEGLEPLFNSVCGAVELVNRSSVDYEKKMREYLDGLFGDDELYMSVQKVFSCRIFLSYRKKDRQHILPLMQMLHQSDACQDIAIWYDDFLTLGEAYDNEIDNYINTSEIFVLAVTPNLLEPENYVMKIEYPKACALRKRIIPVELLPTDREALQQAYPGLPECIQISDIRTLEDTLQKARQDLQTEAGLPSAERDYLLGQAYLKGISVEMNRERGITLLRKAAQADHLRAAYHLGRIYFTGQGMERDLVEAQRWLEKHAQLSREGFQREKTFPWGVTQTLSLMTLSDCYCERNDLATAKSLLLEAAEASNWLRETGALGTATNLGNVWMRLGRICAIEEDYEAAMHYCNKAEKILEVMYQTTETPQSISSYASILVMQGEQYDRLFDLNRDENCLHQAIAYYEKAKMLQERLVGAYRQTQAISAWMDIADSLGAVYVKLAIQQRNPDERIVCMEKVRKYYWELYECKWTTPEKQLQYLYQYAVYTNQAGILRENKGEIENARTYYINAYNIHTDMCNVRGYDEDYCSLAITGVNLAIAGLETPDQELLMEAYRIFEWLCKKHPENDMYRFYMDTALNHLQQ